MGVWGQVLEGFRSRKVTNTGLGGSSILYSSFWVLSTYSVELSYRNGIQFLLSFNKNLEVISDIGIWCFLEFSLGRWVKKIKETGTCLKHVLDVFFDYDNVKNTEAQNKTDFSPNGLFISVVVNSWSCVLARNSYVPPHGDPPLCCGSAGLAAIGVTPAVLSAHGEPWRTVVLCAVYTCILVPASST